MHTELYHPQPWMSIKSQLSGNLIRTQSDCKAFLFHDFIFSIIHLSIGRSTPVKGLTPSLPSSTLGRPPSGAWPGCSLSSPSQTPSSHHPSLPSPPNPIPNISPPPPPTRPNMHGVVGPANLLKFLNHDIPKDIFRKIQLFLHMLLNS